MEKVAIFDWGGVVETHERNLQDLKNAKIRVIKRFNKTLSDKEIIEKWTDKTSNGIFAGTINNEQDIKDWINLVQKNMNICMFFEEFKKSYEEELSTVKFYKYVVEYAYSLKNRCIISILSNLYLLIERELTINLI